MRSLPRAAALTVACAISSLACSGGTASTSNADAGPPLLPNMGTAQIGPIDVAAGGEETVCILKRLNNADDIMATSFVADLAPGSHHMIVYKSTATDEDLTPFACAPFVGLVEGTDVPIMLVNKLHLEYSFPPNVGMQIPKGQMLKIEAHYINTSGADIQGQGSIEVHGLPLSQAADYQPADFAFWGTKKINIPPKSTTSTPIKFQAGIAGTKVFALTSHQHELGTHVQVWQLPGAPPAGASTSPDPSTLVLDETNWASPQLKSFDPAITFDGSSGFAYQCTWDNATDQTVTFGESALNEMCFLGAYYYPSRGFDICIDGHCLAR